MRARHVQLLLDLLLDALFLEQARILQNGGGFDGQGLQQLAIAARQIGGGQARIHVEHAGRLLGRGEQRWWRRRAPC